VHREHHGDDLFGAGHVVGTYRMGADPKTSVVNADQRAHDHSNLFLLGSGVFPTSASSNPTLTIAALALRAVGAIRSSDRRLKRTCQINKTRGTSDTEPKRVALAGGAGRPCARDEHRKHKAGKPITLRFGAHHERRRCFAARDAFAVGACALNLGAQCLCGLRSLCFCGVFLWVSYGAGR